MALIRRLCGCGWTRLGPRLDTLFDGRVQRTATVSRSVSNRSAYVRRVTCGFSCPSILRQRSTFDPGTDRQTGRRVPEFVRSDPLDLGPLNRAGEPSAARLRSGKVLLPSPNTRSSGPRPWICFFSSAITNLGTGTSRGSSSLGSQQRGRCPTAPRFRHAQAPAHFIHVANPQRDRLTPADPGVGQREDQGPMLPRLIGQPRHVVVIQVDVLGLGLVGFSRFCGSKPRAWFFKIRPSAIASSRMPARTPSARKTVVAEQPAPVIDADQFFTAVAETLFTGTLAHSRDTCTRHAMSSIRLCDGSVVAFFRSSQGCARSPTLARPFEGADELAPVHL